MDGSQDSLRQTANVLNLLRQIGRVCVRAKSADSLYADICVAATQGGTFRYAWVGVFEPLSCELRMLSAEGTAILFPGAACNLRDFVESVRLADRPQTYAQAGHGACLGLPDRKSVV